MRRAPPPSGSAPQMGLEALEVVKKKVSAPPRGPPPPGMTINFKGPRQVERPTTSNRGAKDYDDRYDDDRDRDYDRSFQDDDRADYRDRDGDRDDDNNNRDYRDRNNSQDRYYSDDDDDRDRYYNDDYDDHYRENQERGHGDPRDTRDTRPFPDEHSDSHHHHSYSADADGKDYVPAQQHHHYQQQPSSSNNNNNQYVKQKAPPSPEAKAALSANNNNFNKNNANNPNTNTNNNSNSNNNVAAPKKTVVFNFQPILKSTYRELRHFVLSPCQPGLIVRCYIERNRSGAKMLAPFYSLCADLEDGTGRELVVCRKVWQSRTSHYVFSLKSEDLWLDRERRSRLYLGKLRAVGHGEYVLYDNGICAAPDADDTLLEEIEEAQHSGVAVHSDVNDTNIARKMDRDRANEAKHTGGSGAKHGEDVCLYRREMAVIKFNALNRPAPQCVRGLEVCIPTVSPSVVAEAKPSGVATPAGPSITSQLVAQPAVFNLEKPFKKIRDLGRQNDLYRKTCLVLHERASRYDPLSACLVEFKGRAHMASIKNFQMVVSEPQSQFGLPSPGTHEQMMRADSDKEFVFMMAKTTEDCFNMDFKQPLSLFQAFAIAIARFDAKLSW